MPIIDIAKAGVSMDLFYNFPVHSKKKISAALLSISLLVSCDTSTLGPTAPLGTATTPNWTARTSGTKNNLRGVTWTGKQLVAVGDLGTILTSPDGVNWTMRPSSVSNNPFCNLYSVVWTGSQLVAVGTLGTVVTSPDGVTWTVQNPNIVDNPVSNLYSVVWTGSRIVTVGLFGTVATSPDGVNWKEQNNITFRPLHSLAVSNNQIATVGFGATGTSPDDSTWTVQSLGTVTDSLYSVVWTGGQFVAVGGNGTHSAPHLVSPNAIILTSPDGKIWKSQNSGLLNNPLSSLMSVAWSGPSANSEIGQLLAVGQYGAIVVSPDGVNWTVASSGTVNLSSAVAADDQWVVVGDSGSIQTAPVSGFSFNITAPGTPTGVTALAGNVQASVSWMAPVSNGGSIITGYVVRAVQDTSKHCADTALSCVVTGLTNGTSYTFTVIATNAKGAGTPSSPSSPVTPATTPPSAPANVMAFPGNTQATVSWEAPASDGGLVITGYVARATQDTSRQCSTTGLSCIVTGLTNETSYTFSVTAINAKGAGASSLPSSPVTPATPPGSPTNVGGASDYAQVIVSWVSPASDGGSAITQYMATAVQDTSKHCATATLSCAVTGLSNGTSYTFTVTASNAVGTGLPSLPSPIATPAAFPGAIWMTQHSGTMSALLGSIWAGTQWVVVGGSGTILTSPNGVTWTSRNSGTTSDLNAITWTSPGSGQLVAVGNSGIILTSPDGVVWSARNSGTTTNLSSVAWTGTKLAAVGGVILTSSDGVTWTPQNSASPTPLHSITWTGSQLVAVSFSGNIVTSPDGINWTAQNPGVTDILSSVTWNGNNMVVVGGSDSTSGVVLISPDGINWTLRDPETRFALSSVAWSGTHLVATSFYGNIITSPDGENWTARTSGVSSQLNFIAWSGADSTWVAVGANGTIVTSH